MLPAAIMHLLRLWTLPVSLWTHHVEWTDAVVPGVDVIVVRGGSLCVLPDEAVWCLRLVGEQEPIVIALFRPGQWRPFQTFAVADETFLDWAVGVDEVPARGSVSDLDCNRRVDLSVAFNGFAEYGANRDTILLAGKDGLFRLQDDVNEALPGMGYVVDCRRRTIKVNHKAAYDYWDDLYRWRGGALVHVQRDEKDYYMDDSYRHTVQRFRHGGWVTVLDRFERRR